MKRFVIALLITTTIAGSAAAYSDITALLDTVLAEKNVCVVPFEWCTLGCPELGAYSLVAFASAAEEQAFEASLTLLQQDTVRRTTFPAYAKHIVVAYRVPAGVTPQTSVTIGICPAATVTLRGYVAIETAAVEANRLSIDQRAQLALFTVLPAPINDPNTRALLLVRQEAEHGDVNQ